MALEPLRIVKNWFKRTYTREENWDGINNPLSGWATRVTNYLRQIGLDINGSDYSFNGNGVATQETSLVDRITALEDTSSSVGTRNLGLFYDATDKDAINIVAADGTALTASNKGIVTFNETDTPGHLVSRNVTANVQLAMTGAHWGLDTLGDRTEDIFWLLWIDDKDTNLPILGVAIRGGLETVAAANCKSTATDVTSADLILVSDTVGNNSSCTYMGWFRADFTDAGDIWELQSGIGDINLQPVQTVFEGEIRY